MFVKTPNGFPVQSPWLAVSNKAIEMYKSLCAEHCITQASRARAAPGDGQLALAGFEEPAGAPVGWNAV
jgi:hypothetical protein